MSTQSPHLLKDMIERKIAPQKLEAQMLKETPWFYFVHCDTREEQHFIESNNNNSELSEEAKKLINWCLDK